ncbi:hypothetical protein K7X08_029079 [Anisodus acutangulus]|uniref:Uncharacterized protein n=1 Tax=Anisodus acutangulus TaxID=402998 RepID=A0A9Q1L1M9_9SOLA|nr:hypothetical protein K7X08_029079 [Anisodus acutangulus]
MEFASWKNCVEEMKPGEIQILPGLPESMALSYSDIKRNHHGLDHHDGWRSLLNVQNDPSGPPVSTRRLADFGDGGAFPEIHYAQREIQSSGCNAVTASERDNAEREGKERDGTPGVGPQGKI